MNNVIKFISKLEREKLKLVQANIIRTEELLNKIKAKNLEEESAMAQRNPFVNKGKHRGNESCIKLFIERPI